MIYRADDVRFEYRLGTQKVEALRGVSFQLPEGAFVCLMGPSGSGKSTLLNLLGLIEKPQQGNIEMIGRDLARLSETEKDKIRKHELGFVFQSFNLFPVLSAEENVEYFLARQNVGASEREKRVRAALEAVGLWEHRSKKPLEMSGGQRQRVAIARALAKQPRVIIADEPTASLDQRTGAEVMEIFSRLNRETGTAIIVSSHDPMVQSLVQNKLWLKDGVLTGGAA
jgi:putative ABC transport system ATP-binding protein